MDSIPLDPAIWKLVFESSCDGLLLLDAGAIRQANATAVSILGKASAQELLGLSLLERLAEPDADVQAALAGELVPSESPFVAPVTLEGRTCQLALMPLSSQVVLVRLTPEEGDEEEKRIGEESLLQLVLDSIPIGVFWKDRESRFLGCNKHFSQDAGFASPSEIVGLSDDDMPWAADAAEAYQRDDRRVMEEDAPQTKITERQLQADGRHAYVETYKVPMHDSDGNVIGILGSYEDITERKLAEMSLQEFSEGLHMMARTTADKSGQKFFESCVQAMAELTGFTTALIGVMDPNDDAIIMPKALWHQGRLADRNSIDLHDSPLEEAVRTKGLVSMTHAVREYHPGNAFLQEVAAEAFVGLPITLANGEPGGFFCAIDSKPLERSFDQLQLIVELFAGRIGVELERCWAMETLERKIASANLLESISSQIRASFDHDEIVHSTIAKLGAGMAVDRCLILGYHLSPKPELLLTAEHVSDGVESIDEWNLKIEGDPFFQTLLGQDEVLAFDDTSDAPMLNKLAAVLREMDVHSMLAVQTSYQNQTNGILLLQQCRGKRSWSQAERALVKSVADMVGIAIGQAQMFEHERLQRHELARKNRALAKAKAAADSANHAKSEFLSRMSHELRTPLNAILGFSQVMARDDFATDQQKQNLSTITRSGTHLLEMINDVLEMSRIEAGEVSVEPTSFNLEELLDSVVSMFQTRAHPGVKLKLGIASTVPIYARTDEVKLRQILINLFGNAVKFTTEGEVALRVRAELRHPEGVSSAWNLIASVHDTGPGIREDEAGLLFQPFCQTEAGQRLQQGTGLGLPISRQFARLLGGDIAVKSLKGEGTIFSLTIPCGEADPAELDDRRIAQSQRARGLAPRQRPPKVLLVDDHQESRVWLEMLLGSIGLPAMTAANGAEALEICETTRPDIVFMDIHMPVMDGDTAALALREKLGNRAPLLVALTASAFIGGKDRVSEGPFDLFVTKPVHEKSLVEIFETGLGVRFDYGETESENWYLPERQQTPSVMNQEEQTELVMTPLDSDSYEGESEVRPDEELAIDPPSAAEESEVREEAPVVSPATQALCRMPRSWLDRMEQASACLNLRDARDLLGVLHAEHPEVALPLIKWCEDYQFEKLQTELEQARHHCHATC